MGQSACWEIREGDALKRFRDMPDESVQCCITSPPYFGLRDYGTGECQIGLEPTPDEYVARLVDVFREVRRVLRQDGTLWLNIGDNYASQPPGIKSADRYRTSTIGAPPGLRDGILASETASKLDTSRLPGIKQKDLLGIPWLVAFALRADGWYLRSDIIWAKPNPMPESVTDRPTSAHEHVFLLAKSARYYYDADAIREDNAESSIARRGLMKRVSAKDGLRTEGDPTGVTHGEGEIVAEYGVGGRNRRNVWEIATQPYPDAHFATFPPKLIEPCILAGAPVGGTVLDPFAGAGTTGLVALRHGRAFIGIELNPAYAEMARWRIRDDAPLLNTHTEVAA